MGISYLFLIREKGWYQFRCILGIICAPQSVTLKQLIIRCYTGCICFWNCSLNITTVLELFIWNWSFLLCACFMYVHTANQKRFLLNEKFARRKPSIKKMCNSAICWPPSLLSYICRHWRSHCRESRTPVTWPKLRNELNLAREINTLKVCTYNEKQTQIKMEINYSFK